MPNAGKLCAPTMFDVLKYKASRAFKLTDLLVSLYSELKWDSDKLQLFIFHRRSTYVPQQTLRQGTTKYFLNVNVSNQDKIVDTS
jgi:hypothetical protein